MYERPDNEDYEFPTVALDEIYLNTVAVLAAGRNRLPDAARETVLAIEKQSEQEITEAPASNISRAAGNHLVVISAMRQFGLLSEHADTPE